MKILLEFLYPAIAHNLAYNTVGSLVVFFVTYVFLRMGITNAYKTKTTVQQHSNKHEFGNLLTQIIAIFLLLYIVGNVVLWIMFGLFVDNGGTSISTTEGTFLHMTFILYWLVYAAYSTNIVLFKDFTITN